MAIPWKSDPAVATAWPVNSTLSLSSEAKAGMALHALYVCFTGLRGYYAHIKSH